MSTAEALDLAIALHARPQRAAELRARALPSDGVSTLLRIALGQADALDEAAKQTGLDRDQLSDVARFYIEQQMLVQECEHDPWRVLGLLPGSGEGRLREHHRLLVRLVHPDRGSDWPPAFADRVNKSWKQLRRPEGRSGALVGALTTYPASGTEAAGLKMPTPAPYRPAFLRNEGIGPVHAAPQPLRRLPLYVGGGIVMAAVALLLLDGWVARQYGDPPQALQPALAEEKVAIEDVPVAEEVAAPVPEPVDYAPPEATGAGAMLPIAASIEPQPAAAGAGAAAVSDESGRSVAASRSVETAASAPPARSEAEAERAAPAKSIAARPRSAPADRQVSAPVDRRRSAPLLSDDHAPIAVKPGSALTVPGDGRSPEAPAAPAAAVLQAPVPDAGASGSAIRTAQQAESGAVMAQALHSPGLGDREVRSLLDRFGSHYRDGDLMAMLDLFALEANAQEGGVPVLAAEFSQVFGATLSREVRFLGVHWREEQGRIRGGARFEARMRESGRSLRRVSSGQVEFEVLVQGERVRFLRWVATPMVGGV